MTIEIIKNASYQTELTLEQEKVIDNLMETFNPTVGLTKKQQDALSAYIKLPNDE